GTIFGVPFRKMASPGTNLVPSASEIVVINRSIGMASCSSRFSTNARPSFQVMRIVNSTAPIRIGTQPPEAIFKDVEATKTKSNARNGTANKATLQTGQRQKP